MMTDEEIGAWTSAHDVPQWATTPEGRLVSESYIRTSDVTAKLRELRDYAERMENHRLALIETAVQQRDRIAALEAELATLRAVTWQPVEYVQLPRGESIHADEMAITHGRDNTALWTMPLPDDGDIRLCRRVPSAHADLLAAAKALLGLCEDYDIPMMADEPVEYRHLTRDAMNHLQAAIERAEATQPEPITQEALRQQEPVAIRELYVNADGTLRIETADRWDMRYAYTVVRLLTGKEARHE